MYDTTSRSITFRSTTGENVGPNTYIICNPRSKKQTCAPFSSSAPKSFTLPSAIYTHAIYDTRHWRNRIKGGSILQNKGKRFVYKVNDVPPPTHYNPKPIQGRRKKLKFDPTKPKLYFCRVPYSSKASAPSIPTKMDENGYELDDDGNMTKVPPDEEIPEEVNIPSTIGKGPGWRWACRTSHRFKERQYETYGPGPAAHSVKMPKCLRAEEDEMYREMARRFSFVPRFVEAQELKAAKEKQPGPGSYDVVEEKWKKKSSEGVGPRPFIAGAARFTEGVSHSPAPTAYDVCDDARKKRTFSMKGVPFGAQSTRFKRKIEISPGPGSYTIKGALQEKLQKKMNPYALCEPPFYSTSLRNYNCVSKDSLYMPSSADYPECKEPDEDEEKLDIYSSVFKNMVCRFYSPAEKKDYIGPGKYNVSESFCKNRDRKSFNVAKVGFNTTGPRSTTPQVKLGVPCPTTYKTKRKYDYRGYYFPLSPRFTCEEETPGPGLYNIHPRFVDSTFKSVDTHNLALKENILRKKLRLAPAETRENWLASMKKRRLLKWFNVELNYEERMIRLISKLFAKPI